MQGKENKKEKEKKSIKKCKKNRFKINKLFLYAISNSFYLFFPLYVNIK